MPLHRLRAPVTVDTAIVRADETRAFRAATTRMSMAGQQLMLARPKLEHLQALVWPSKEARVRSKRPPASIAFL